MRSKNVDQPCPAPSYCSGGHVPPRCSKRISVRPSPRSVRTTVTSCVRVVVGLVGDREHEPLGLDDLAVLALSSGSRGARVGEHRRPPRAARPDVHRDRRERHLRTRRRRTSRRTRSGSVHSRQTRSRGASKTRDDREAGLSHQLRRSSRRSKPSCQKRGTSRASRPRPSAAPPPGATAAAAPSGRA